MKRMLLLLCAENKRAWKIFPKMLLQAIVLALVAGTIAFCATNLLYRDTPTQVRVAVVVEEDNQLTEFALEYVKQEEEGVEFVECNRETALDGLKENEFAAVIILPKQLIEGILSGENFAVTVICNENLSVAGGFLKELTQAGATLLSTAQAEIYAIYELAGEVGAENQLEELQNAINMENLNLAMGRKTIFYEKTISATGSFSVQVYYTASAIVAILLFLGIPMGMFLKQDGKTVLRQYSRVGIGAGKQQFVRWITAFGIYGVVCVIGCFFAVMKGYSGDNFMMLFGIMWIVSGSIAAFLLLIYEITEKKSSAVLLTTFLAVMLLFLSGGIIPKVFFNGELRRIADYLPSTFWLEGIGTALDGRLSGREIMAGTLYGLLFFSGAVLLRRKKVVEG